MLVPVTRDQILAELGGEFKPAEPMRADAMRPGTLAICDLDNRSERLMLVLNDHNWGFLYTEDVARHEFGPACGELHGRVLLSDIPADAWDAIRAEKSQIKRVRIARAACGLNPREPELIDAAGLRTTPPEQSFASMRAGTLAVTGPLLGLVTTDGRWGYLVNGSKKNCSIFTPAGMDHTARVLVTGIPASAWNAICSEPSQLERVRIAVAAALAAENKPGGSDGAARIDVAAPVDDELYRELVVGLCTPLAPSLIDPRSLLAATNGDLIHIMLTSVGIQSRLVRTNGGGEREDLYVASHDWPYDGSDTPAGRGGTPLYTLGPAERVARLLDVTRERRMLAHLWTHRGVLKRLQSWYGLMPDFTPAATASSCWAYNDTKSNKSLLLQLLGIALEPSTMRMSVRWHGGTFGFDAQRLLDIGTFEAKCDLPATVGHVLRRATDAVWQATGGARTRPPSSTAWLADTVPISDESHACGVAGVVRYRIAEFFPRGYNPHLIHVRVVSTGALYGDVQAPVGLQVCRVGPGISALVETTASLGLTYRKQAAAAHALRAARTRGPMPYDLDNVYVADLDSPDYASSELYHSRPSDPTKAP